MFECDFVTFSAYQSRDLKSSNIEDMTGCGEYRKNALLDKVFVMYSVTVFLLNIFIKLS